MSHRELLVWREIPLLSPREVRYSNGGGCFAASSGVDIVLFDSYSHARLGVMHGHATPVVQLRWGSADATLSSAGADGMLYTWQVAGATGGKYARVHEQRVKQTAIASFAVLAGQQLERSAMAGAAGTAAAAAAVEPELVLAVGNDGVLRRMGHFVERIELGEAMSCIAPLPGSGRVLVGDANGGIRLLDEKFAPDGPALVAHGGAVSHMLAFHDGSFVFAAGADGTIFVLHAAAADGTWVESNQIFAEVHCTTQASLEAAETALEDANTSYQQLEAASQSDLARLEASLRDQVGSEAAKHAAQLSETELRLTAMRSERGAELAVAQRRFADFANNMEEQRREMRTHLEECLQREIQRHEDVAAELAAARAQAGQQLEDASAQLVHETARSAAEREAFAAQTARMEGAWTEHLRRYKGHCVTTMVHEEEEHELELTRERQTHQAVAARQAEEITLLRSTSFLVHKKLEMHQQEIS